MPIRLRLVTKAQVYYDSDANDADTDTWIDYVTPAQIMSGGHGAEPWAATGGPERVCMMVLGSL